MTPLFQNNLSFRQVMAAASSLVCGYTEGAFSRVTSFNWYEDNNYKAFLGINSGRGQSHYTYDNNTSKLSRYLWISMTDSRVGIVSVSSFWFCFKTRVLVLETGAKVLSFFMAATLPLCYISVDLLV